jgi:uncharacterized protein (TIGR00730 family)
VRSVCVFCGSSSGARPEYADAARVIGRTLGQRGISLVYGGGRVGLMGIVADAALQANGRVTGVIPRMLFDREIGHSTLSEMKVVASLAERKTVMGELSDAFIVLPGGVGTLDELFEVWSWTQLDLHAKPCGLLNTGGYFDPLLQFLDHATSEGFISRRSRESLLVEQQCDPLIAALEAWKAN